MGGRESERRAGGAGMVFFCGEGQETRRGKREGEPDDRKRFLESDRFGPANSEQFAVGREESVGDEEDSGVLPRKSSKRAQN